MDAQDSSDNVDSRVQSGVQTTPHVRRDVHKAAQFVHSLADRVGHTDGQDVPRAMASAAQHIDSMIVGGTTVSGHDAAVVGWEALSEVMRSWDIRSREDLFRVDPPPRFPSTAFGGPYHRTGTGKDPHHGSWVESSSRAGGVVGVQACAFASGTDPPRGSQGDRQSTTSTSQKRVQRIVGQ